MDLEKPTPPKRSPKLSDGTAYTLILEAADLRAVQAHAHRNGVTVGRQFREAIAEWLEQQEATP